MSRHKGPTPKVETRGVVLRVQTRSGLIGLGSRKLPMGCQIFNRRLGKSLDLTVSCSEGHRESLTQDLTQGHPRVLGRLPVPDHQTRSRPIGLGSRNLPTGGLFFNRGL